MNAPSSNCARQIVTRRPCSSSRRRCAATAREHGARHRRDRRGSARGRQARSSRRRSRRPRAAARTPARRARLRAGGRRSRPSARTRPRHRARRARRSPAQRPDRRRARPTVSWIVTPVSVSPARIARSTGAAPRQRGSSDGCTFSQSDRVEQRAAECRGRTRRRRRGRPAAGSSGRSGWCTGMPSCSATCFAGGGASLRPRPRGASGRVSRKATRASRRAARARRRRAAPSRRRRSAAVPLPQNGARPQRRERLFAVLVVGAVDDQHAVQMVELVLHDARAVLVELEANVLAVRRPCLRASR